MAASIFPCDICNDAINLLDKSSYHKVTEKGANSWNHVHSKSDHPAVILTSYTTVNPRYTHTLCYQKNMPKNPKRKPTNKKKPKNKQTEKRIRTKQTKQHKDQTNVAEMKK